MATEASFAADAPFPNTTVKLIVPFSPGGATDLMARLLSQKLQEAWGQPVVVDYHPGADTIIGIDYVAKSPPDGYTLGLVNSAVTINPALRKKLPFDTLKDLRGVTQFGSIQTALVANNKAPFNNMREMIAYARAHPGQLNYANSGAGSVSSLALEQMKRQESFDMLNVTFKGGSQVVTELLAGRIDVASEPFVVVLPYLLDGRMKMIGTFGSKRLSGYEDRFATIDESVPGTAAESLLGIIAPAATPDAIVRKIQLDVAAIVQEPGIRKKLQEMGVEPLGSTPQAFDALLRSEMQRWAAVAASANIAKE